MPRMPSFLELSARTGRLDCWATPYSMGISRDSLHKRRLTGGKQEKWRKKRKYELGRQPANTKLAPMTNNAVRKVRVRGGNTKFRALRLDTGNFSWGSEAATRKTRILAVNYNASNNELVRTNTLVKGAIIQVDSTPFKQYYLQHYGVELGLKKKIAAVEEATGGQEHVTSQAEQVKRSKHAQRKIDSRNKERALDPYLDDQFTTGRLFACIASRPGQCGRADGYILEGRELEFYQRRMQRRKAKTQGASGV